ncbi:hemolysin-III related-domain-containing protein [Elsinoe ampelina]|uniref:Hemolysin-III related-domain-containing protein n=1 Tax=Elsinoe ampelina TaxID=302913 RepID=A0A6A6G8N1_9PEZI|nr:hemolysin-III related-domain-containing protein [Elsinoe ampelina]
MLCTRTIRSGTMTCTATTSTSMTESFEEPALSSPSYGTFDAAATDKARKQRRHSSYQPQTWHIDTDDIQILVDRFLAQLGKRLDFLEEYGHVKLDDRIERAYDTLRTVHDSCTRVSDEMIDAGWRRAKVFVETLEDGYRDALARKQTMEAKAREGIRLMESMLHDFESKAYELQSTGLTAVASDMYESGKRHLDDGAIRAAELMDEGMLKARHAKAALTARIENALKIAKENGLIAYNDLPDPWKVNPHITRGYRFCDTKLECVRSCFYFSNETVNIWSHLVGLIIIIGIAFYAYPLSPNFSKYTNADILIAAVFFFAACKCLFCSVCWHAMSAHSSQKLMERFACVDYTGISFLVAASIMTTEYTAFYCEPISRWTYMMTTLALGIGGTILPWRPFFNKAENAWLRVGFYVTLACTGFFPVAQLIMTRGVDWAMYFYAPITKSLLFYLCGACLYAAKIPERWFPGFFDYVGGSHNIWHLAVLGGILFHYEAMKAFFAEALRRGQSGCSVY